MAERTGVPIEMLTFIREAAGSVTPSPDSRMREAELPAAAWLAAAVGASFRPAAMQQMIRVHADSLRRVAETEAAMWQSEVLDAGTRTGSRTDEILGIEFGDRMSILTEEGVIAMYHMQQAKAWTRNLVEGVETMLAEAGLHSRLERPPAMCFLDITGYTRLTQERGDEAAAGLADELGRLVQRASIKHGGRAVKWLGDGVMLHFPDPGPGVTAALEMVDRGRRGRPATRARRPSRRAGDLPGGRLLRADGQRCVPDCRVRAPRRGDRQPGGGGCLPACRRLIPGHRRGRAQGSRRRPSPSRRVVAQLIDVAHSGSSTKRGIVRFVRFWYVA